MQEEWYLIAYVVIALGMFWWAAMALDSRTFSLC